MKYSFTGSIRNHVNEPTIMVWAKVFTVLTFIAKLLAISRAINPPRNMQFCKCFVTSPYKTTSGKSFEKCQDECVKSPDCKGVVYDRRLAVCFLHSSVGAELQSCPGKVLVLRKDIVKTSAEVCGVDNCPVSDCRASPDIDGDAITKGNQVLFDSIVKVTCTHNNNVTFVQCQENGAWTERVNCVNPDCGVLNPPLFTSVNTAGSTLIGATVTLTCVTGYRFDPPALQLEITCLTNGTWEWMASTCVKVTNAGPCASDEDCVDPNSICVGRTQSDPSSNRCFCKPNFTYNTTYSVCDNECSLKNDFDEVPGYKILQYYAGFQAVPDVEGCKAYCNSISAMGADYLFGSLECYCNTITRGQALESDPSMLTQATDSILLTKVCS